jgi:hypothetical protein
MRVAAKAFHFEISIARIDRIAQRGLWLRWSLKAEHAFVPRLAVVGLLPRFGSPFCRRPDRCAVNGLA